MAKTDLERVTEEKIQKGGVLSKLYFDMQDKDKEKLQPLMANLINDHLLKEKGVVYCYGAIDEPILFKDLYTTSAVVTVLTDSFLPLVNIAFNYAPAGIEVLRPEKGIQLKANEMQAILIDISQISINYSRYVLEKVLKKEDIEFLQRELENRERIGKALLEKKTEERQGSETGK
ncbi:MAG: hypothetical protein QXK65_01465 [Candidatus Micrarchaeaceae archaeon]